MDGLYDWKSLNVHVEGLFSDWVYHNKYKTLFKYAC